jgi:hypothetical protein
MSLPPVPSDVVAEAVDALPARLRARLEQTVRAARDWPVTVQDSGVDVAADADVTVHVRQPARSGADVVCTCLLSPRCLHRAAVLSLAPSVESPPEPPSPEPSSPRPSIVDEDPLTPVTAAQARAAQALWRAGASVLETGIPGAGEVTRAGLLRAAHAARAAGLHRGAAAAVRVVEHLRAAASEDPAFRLADLVAALRDLLWLAYRLSQPGAVAGSELRGVARREYRLAAGARLFGLCVEPVATASGYAGAVTLLADYQGTVWQVSTVVPGGPDVARVAARRPVSVGEVRLKHTDLGRAGLLAAKLRASADGRISSGRDTAAVHAEGVTWWQPPLSALWERPWAEQIERYLAGHEQPPAQRPAVAGLLFLDAVVTGTSGGGVGLAVGDRHVIAVAAHESPELSYVDNLRLLAQAVGASVRLVARPAGRRHVAPVAFAADWLPQPYGGHVDLGLDRLRRSDMPALRAAVVPVAESDTPPPPLHPLRRRLERAVEGGRSAVPGDPADLARLAATLPRAAELARRLDAASRPRRDAFGRILQSTVDDGDFARAWLAGATYAHAALRSAERDDWLGGEIPSSRR